MFQLALDSCGSTPPGPTTACIPLAYRTLARQLGARVCKRKGDRYRRTSSGIAYSALKRFEKLANYPEKSVVQEAKIIEGQFELAGIPFTKHLQKRLERARKRLLASPRPEVHYC